MTKLNSIPSATRFCACVAGLSLLTLFSCRPGYPQTTETLLPNVDFSAGTNLPTGWELSKDATPTVKLTRDTKTFRSAPAALLLDTGGVAGRAAAQSVFASVPTAGGSVQVRGFSKATGTDWKQFQLVLQIFNADWSQQLGWITTDLPRDADWKPWDKSVTMPQGAAHVIAYVSMEGSGKAWVDDVSVKAIVGATPASGTPTVIMPTAPVTIKTGQPPYRWDNVIMGGVEYATGLIWSPTNPRDLYLRADGGGIWRLDRKKRGWIPLLDQQTWKDRNLNTVDSVAVDSSNPRVLYVAGGGSRWGKPHDVLKSVDGGVTWRRTLLKNEQGEDVISEGNGGDKQGGERLLVDSRDSKTVWFASRNDGLFVSRDGAKTWRPVKSFPTKGGRWHGLTFVAADAARNTLYVGVHAGAATDEPNATRIASAVYRSTDNGVTWEPITARKGDPGGESSPLRMRIAPDGTAYVTYNGTGSWDTGGIGGGVWKYAKGTWRDVTPAQGKDKPFCGINLHPKDPRKILCATTYNTDGTIYYSENAGDTWREYRFDKNNHDKGTLILGDFPAWERGPGHGWGGNASDVAFDPIDPRVVYFTSFSGPCVGTGVGTDRMRFSLLGDGREQMTTASGVSPTKGAPFVSGVWDVGGFRHEAFDKIPETRSPLLGANGTAFTGYDAYRDSFQDTFDMDASPKMPDVIVAAGGWQWNMTGTAAISRDNGRTFREFAAKPTPDAKFGRIAVSATDADNIVWVPMNNGGGGDAQPVYFTRDGGKTWDVGSGSPVGMVNGDGPWTFFKPLAADREAAHTFYLYDRRDGGFFVSGDGGENWKRRATLPTQPGNHFDSHQLIAAPGKPGDLWLSLYEKGLLHSADAGKTWSRLTGVEWSVRAALGKPAPGSQTPTVYLYGQIGGTAPKDETGVDAALYRSVDSGESWVRINPVTHGLNGINPLVADMQVFGRVYVGTGGRGFFYGEPAPANRVGVPTTRVNKIHRPGAKPDHSP